LNRTIMDPVTTTDLLTETEARWRRDEVRALIADLHAADVNSGPELAALEDELDDLYDELA